MVEKDIPEAQLDEWYERNRAGMVEEAQKAAEKRGLEIGDTVAHPNHERTFVLHDIVGTTAIVDFPGNEEGALTVPLDELFDPSCARDIILKKYATYLSSSFSNPNSIN